MCRLKGDRPHLISKAILCLAVLVLAGCDTPRREASFTGAAQGTTYSIKVDDGGSISQAAIDAVSEAITTRLAGIDLALSTYRDDSEISGFNAHAESTPFKVSQDLVDVFLLARKVSEASGGAFDVTVGPLVDAWGFGADGEVPKDIPVAELAALRERVGYDKIDVDAAASTLRKTRPDVECNVNAIAQGYTVDRLAADLDALGHTDYMVEVGGEVKARGLNARGVPWQIGIELPIIEGTGVARVVGLKDCALATSGDYRHYREVNGVRVSHTIDPRTGRPIAHALASVSAFHERCAAADAFSTALMVLGPEAGYNLAIEQNLAALFIVHDGDGTFAEKATPRYTQMFGQ